MWLKELLSVEFFLDVKAILLYSLRENILKADTSKTLSPLEKLDVSLDLFLNY